MKNIKSALIIKLDDLVGFVASFAAMKQIRLGHPHARITLMTSPAFAGLAKASPYFDAVEIPTKLDPMSLGRAIRQMNFDSIYDLDASGRSAALRRWAWPSRAAWSVTSRNGRVPLPDRHAAQLKADGVWPDAPVDGSGACPDLAWISGQAPSVRPSAGGIKPRPYVLFAPGGPEHRRWPTAHFGAIAEAFRGQGFDVIILGQPEDSVLARQIQKLDPRARDLTGRTDYAVIASLACRAALAIGHESDLLHLIAAAGAPTLALFDAKADALQAAPRGHVTVLQHPDLATLTPAQVMRATHALAPQRALAS
jgi:ADP-heptose:LPS heptosyltransferase